MIGVFFVGLIAAPVGVAMIVVQVLPTVLAKWMPLWLRLLCFAPGLLALLFAAWIFLA
jgi:hypothetical protein